MSLILHLDSTDRVLDLHIQSGNGDITNSPADYGINVARTLNNNVNWKTVGFRQPCAIPPPFFTYTVQLNHLIVPNVAILVPEYTTERLNPGPPPLPPPPGPITFGAVSELITSAFPYYFVEFWTGSDRRQQAMITSNQEAVRAVFVVRFDKTTPAAPGGAVTGQYPNEWVVFKSDDSPILQLDFINSEIIRFRMFTPNGDTVIISTLDGGLEVPFRRDRQTSAVFSIRPNILTEP